MAALAAVPLAALSCRGGQPGNTDRGDTAMTRQEGDAYTEIEPGADLARLEGRRVRLAGRLSDIPWQHIIRIPETHRHIEYLDHGRGQQTVLYLREPPTCRGSVAIFGTIVKTEGGSKRPGTNDPVTEHQLIVDRCECLR